ncbi:MAG: glycosyl transferase [Chloroflexi bacterium]|nr:glycosyl transferase [Chloroflexota bacterium]
MNTESAIRNTCPTPQVLGPQSEIGYSFCTYFDRNYLTRGLALYHSLVRYCQKPFTLWVLCFDNETYDVLARLDLPGVRLISQQEFEAGDEALVRTKDERSRVEYYWTCTPSLPLYILRHHPQVEIVTYLDADLYFYSDPQPIYDELSAGSILIIEHRYAPEHAHHAATSGVYNVGVMAFRRDEHGLACLEWWRERCLEWCYMRMEDGKFGDQKYLDDWPERFPGVVVLKHKGAGLAPWNVSRYRLAFADSTVSVDGQPLIFYHFHGYKLISGNIFEPVWYGYRITLDQIRCFYLPYSRALRSAGLLAHIPGTHISWATRSILRGLLDQRLLLLESEWLSLAVWRLGGILTSFKSLYTTTRTRKLNHGI